MQLGIGTACTVAVALQSGSTSIMGGISMKDTRRAFILAAGLTAVTMSLHCETLQAGTSQVSFQSSTYSDFRQLLAR